MFRHLAAAFPVALIAIAVTPQASAQEADDDRSPWYYAIGVAWSDEIGLEVEAGAQFDIGSSLRLRLSPLNVSLIDGDTPDGFRWDDTGGNRVCRETAGNTIAISDECSPEPDTEWRAVAALEWAVAPNFFIGAGAAYQLQGDIARDSERLGGFVSFSWESGEGIGIELRGGEDYAAIRVRSRF